jgi:hypothetical protein
MKNDMLDDFMIIGIIDFFGNTTDCVSWEEAFSSQSYDIDDNLKTDGK